MAVTTSGYLTHGFKWLVQVLGGGELTGITGGWGYNLAAVRALNAAIRAENREDRQQCWANGHFVGVTGKCIEDPEIGVAKALAQLNGDTPFPPGDTRRVRLEGYVANQFYREWENAVESGEGSSIQGVIDKYGQYSDLMSTNPFIGGLSFNIASADQVFERMILGDNEWGAYVKLCSTTVTTNCVDPTAIKDIWEDFGRHVRVIFKGLQIPGLPDWLPLPGIMRIPTLGEIWDKVSGTWNEEVDRQIDECLDEDADGDGTSDNTYDECAERINPAGVIMGGIGNAAEEIYKETAQKIKDIVEKDLEVPCVEDLEACAEKTKQVIGDVFEGVWDSADPTMPGIPDWVRLIIIAGEYGDDFIKILEGQTNSDINGDGVIGITTTQVTCWDGSVVDKEEDCPEDTRVDCWDGSKADSLEQCPVDTRNGAGAEDCNKLGRVHVPDQSNQTKGSCGACSDNVNTVPEDENDPMSPCVAPDNPNLNEGDDCVTGAPLNAEGTVGPAPDYECVPNEGATCTDPETGKDGNIEDGQCVVPVTVEPCTDKNRNVDPDDGSCADTCKDGSPAPASGLCPDPTTQVDCTQPRPGYTPSFNPADNAAHFAWQEACGETHCPDGSTIDSHVNGDCQLGLTSDCQDPQTDEQKRNCGWQECGTETANPGLLVESLDQCGTPVEECSDPNRQKNNDGSCGENCNSGFDQPEGYEVCTSIQQLCSDGAEGYGPDNELCGTTNGCPEGQKKFDGTNCDKPCPDNTDIGASDPLCGATPPETCDNGAINYPDCNQCPKGKILYNGKCVVPTEAPCDEQNRETNNDGTCGECKEGYTFDTNQDLCVRDLEECANGATDYPTCTTCPAGQSMDAEGNCVTTTETCANGATDYPACTTCPEGQSMDENGACVGGTDGGGGGGGSGGGGGGGMFDIKPITISGDPQLLSRTEFPITDFLAGLFTGSGGGRA